MVSTRVHNFANDSLSSAAAHWESQRLYWSMGAVAIAIVPHVAQLPWWIPLLVLAAAAWRVTIELQHRALPNKYFRVLIAVAAMTAVAASYRTLNGLDAGTALLVMMAGVKLLETRGTRDCAILLFIGFVILFSALLYDQSLLRLPYILAAAWLLIAALLRLHQTAHPMPARAALRTTAVMVLQALPLATLLFLFFPRLPGQFWALPARGSAATGLSDEMSPGDISDLTISGAIAFRVKFAGDLPAPADRYWRGPVLHDFDGKRWKREPFRIPIQQTIETTGPGYTYRITLEPTQRDWLIALDVPTQWPETATRTYDWQLITKRPITTLTSFSLQSHTAYRSPAILPRSVRAMDVFLPGQANPRTRAFAKDLRASAGNDGAYIRAILNKFRQEEFYYTLTPALLGNDSVDEFLFNTRRGFCEHFASAFAALMRAADIPARVVLGYQGGEYNSLGEYLLVRQSDAHAWTEVWLEDQGWVRIDPTAAVAPQRIERNLDAAIAEGESVPGRFFRRNLFLSKARLSWDAVNAFWNDRIVEYNELKQRSLMAALGVKDADWRDLGVAFAFTLIAFFTGMSAYLAWSFRTRHRDPLVDVYQALCKKLARAKLTREVHEGPNDYLRRIAHAKPALGKEIEELRSLYVALRYGPTPLATQLSRFKYLVNKINVGRNH